MYKDIYFLNARELSERLHREEISEDLAFKHLLACSMLFASYIAIPIVISCSSSESEAWWYQALSFIVFALIQFLGMNLLYRTNKMGDGKAFFLRWAALSLPVGVQVWLIALLLGAIYGAVVGLSIGSLAREVPSSVWLLTSQIFGGLMQFVHFKFMQQNLTICSIRPQQAAAI